MCPKPSASRCLIKCPTAFLPYRNDLGTPLGTTVNCPKFERSVRVPPAGKPAFASALASSNVSYA